MTKPHEDRQRSWGSLAIVGVVTAAVVLAVLSMRTPPDMSDAKAAELVPAGAMEGYLARLEFLWNRYLEMVQLAITLLTGTVAVSVGMVRVADRKAVRASDHYKVGVMSLIAALGCALLLRILSQALMEAEIFGSADKTQAFFQNSGLKHPFTSSYTLIGYIIPLGVLSRILVAGTTVGFLLGLTELAKFARENVRDPVQANQ